MAGGCYDEVLPKVVILLILLDLFSGNTVDVADFPKDRQGHLMILETRLVAHLHRGLHHLFLGLLQLSMDGIPLLLYRVLAINRIA